MVWMAFPNKHESVQAGNIITDASAKSVLCSDFGLWFLYDYHYWNCNYYLGSLLFILFRTN